MSDERYVYKKELGMIFDTKEGKALMIESVPIAGATSAMVKESVVSESREDGTEAITPEIILLTEGMSYNHRLYTRESMTGNKKDMQGVPSGVKSLVIPDGVPVVINHWHGENPVPGFEATAVGYVESAKFFEQGVKPDQKKAHIRVWPTITDPHAIKLIRDGRIRHVSIFGEADTLTCNLCGKDKLIQERKGDVSEEDIENFCWHIPGMDYTMNEKTGKTKRCEPVIGDWWAREISLVTFPGKRDARIVNIGESFEMNSEDLNMIIGGLLENITRNDVDYSISEGINDEIPDNIEEKDDIILNSMEDTDSDDKESIILNHLTKLHDKIHEGWNSLNSFDSVEGRKLIQEHLDAVEQLYQLTEKTHKVEDNLDTTIWECLQEGDKHDS